MSWISFLFLNEHILMVRGGRSIVYVAYAQHNTRFLIFCLRYGTLA